MSFESPDGALEPKCGARSVYCLHSPSLSRRSPLRVGIFSIKVFFFFKKKNDEFQPCHCATKWGTTTNPATAAADAAIASIAVSAATAEHVV